MKSRYRFRFSKRGRIKFIGHLDLMRVFQRATKRTGLDMAYSQGFNPHQLITIATPLPLGMESLYEILEVVLEGHIEASEIIEGMNRELPAGIEIISGRLLQESEKGAASLAAAAEYEITLDGNPDLRECTADILADKEIIVMKKTKTQEKETDIRGDIFSMAALPEEAERSRLTTVLSAGSGSNLKPELLAAEIYRRLGTTYDAYRIDCLRTKMFELRNGKLLELM